MAKRGAQSDLNHDNWNEEEESEEAGRFAQASEDELKKRVIKTARRRGVGGGTDSGSSGGSSSVFGGFKGFTGVTSTPAVKPAAEGGAAASPFSFLSGIAKPANGTSGTTTAAATTSALGASIFAATDPSKKVFSGFGSPPKDGKDSGKDSGVEEYAANVKALNLAVSAWISEKVKENPLCKLTPIFKDYDKYLDEIEAKKKSSSSSKEAGTKESSPAKPAAPAGGFTFGSVAPVTATTAPAAPAAKPFSFGFGSTAGTASSTPGTGFSFANVAKPAEDSEKAAADDEDDEPPKVEFTPVEEKDSIYSKRCKLFVKADGNYSDRGIGTLHIKKVDTKVQVLVRADTSLGQILLNIILNEAVPVQRMGKNNVMMVCVPTPEAKPPPTSVLLRVKTGEEADELYETLIKHKPK